MTADAEPHDAGLDLDRVRETFEGSTDFTIGIEEEFAIVDPATLDLEHRFEELFEAPCATSCSRRRSRGELIDTEIEIRSGRGETFAEAAARQRERRERLFALAESQGLALAAMGTHPGPTTSTSRSSTRAHYKRLREDLGWVAQRNNTWSLHVHVGVRGADRAVAVCDWMRELLPPLLALSANSPFLDHRDTGLHCVRTEIFTRIFPRCGVHEPFRSWDEYADFVELLERTELGRRGDAALVERPPAPRLRHRRGADLRRADPRRRVVQPGGADDGLRRPDRDRLRRARLRGGSRAAAPARDRGEPVARDPLRAWMAR